MTWIIEIVNGLIEMYETRDVYKLIDKLEIILIRKNLPGNKKGRFFRDMFGNEFIFISDDLCIEEEKIVIAHELGHLILHTDLSTSYYSSNNLLNKDKLEVQANKFAAELLIPDDVEIIEGMTTKELACYLEISEELVNLKYGCDLM